MGPHTWTISALIVVILALLVLDAWKSFRHGQLVKDLTAKIMADDLCDYRTVMENAPPKPVKKERDLRKQPTDPVLGPNY